MKISDKDVRHVAKLAELEFSDEQVKKITPQLDRILEHVARVSAVDTDGVKSTAHVLDVKNVFRDDKPSGTVSQKEALKNAPLKEDNGFRVPRID